ncbi:MAG TPA: DUF397 domain-containing protein [Trebonia sp.]|jgi:hypothetical protein|nr:DUF397 domain-containing protein [Trebonia sp.]
MSSEWRKSSYSGGANNQCVECGTATGSVLVRDATDRDGAALSVSASAWATFTGALR